MKQETEDRLTRECPNLYRDMRGPMQKTCMAWGITCGDGWTKIVTDLSHQLEAMIVALPEDKRPEYRAAQVKEKFGSLCFYMKAETDEMTAAIRRAEKLSVETCEVCGASATVREKRYWLRCRCADHADVIA